MRIYHFDWTIPCTRCRTKTIHIYSDEHYGVDIPYEYGIYCKDCMKQIMFKDSKLMKTLKSFVKGVGKLDDGGDLKYFMRDAEEILIEHFGECRECWNDYEMCDDCYEKKERENE